jgi:hypothetical protein
MKTIPYTTSTGIKMGYRWNESPKPMPIDDPDMELIQGVFICSGKWHRQRNLEKVVYGVSTATLCAVVLAYAMVSK